MHEVHFRCSYDFEAQFHALLHECVVRGLTWLYISSTEHTQVATINKSFLFIEISIQNFNMSKVKKQHSQDIFCISWFSPPRELEGGCYALSVHHQYRCHLPEQRQGYGPVFAVVFDVLSLGSHSEKELVE